MVTINTEILSKIKKIGTWCFIIFIALLCISVFIPNSPVTGILLDIFYAAQNMNAFLAALIIFTINVICVCFMIPSTPVTIFAGLRFGVFLGTCLAQVGCFTGCVIVYWITRFFLYDTVEGMIKNNKMMKSIQKIVEKHGIFFIAMLRASPVFPFPILNYALSPVVSFPSYAIGSFIGLIPANFIVCYISVSINDIADAFVKNTFEASSTIMVVVIICLTVGVIVIITIYLKVQLKKIQQEEESQQLLDEEHQSNESNESNSNRNESDNFENEIDTQNIIEIEDINLNKNKNEIQNNEENLNQINENDHHENETNQTFNDSNEINTITPMTNTIPEKKRVSSPPVNHSNSFNHDESVHSVIIEEEDTYSHNAYGYDNSYLGKNPISSHILVGGDEEDIIQYDDDNDAIIIDENA